MAAPPVADPAESELAADHAFLCEAVREAGALSLRYFRHDPKAWEKNPGDPVSEADRQLPDQRTRCIRLARAGTAGYHRSDRRSTLGA
jgi:hypothetical protein